MYRVLFIIALLLVLLVLLKKDGYSDLEPRIICSMTTIPPRYELLHRTLDSLQNQTRVPDIIYIHVAPETIKSHAQDIPRLYEIAQGYHNVKINVIKKDLGPITKVVPLERLISSSDKVVLVDDDVIYHPSMIQGLLDANLPAAGYAGRKDMNFIAGDTIKEQQESDFLETYAGVMYTGSVLKGLGVYNSSLGETCIMQDDIKIGKFLEKNGVPRIIIPTKEYCKHDAAGTPELNSDNLIGANKSCLKKIKEL